VGRYPSWYARRWVGIPPGMYPGMPPWCICPGVHPWCICPGVHPWVHVRPPAGVPRCRCRTVRAGVTALTRGVTELSVTDASLTVTRFTVGLPFRDPFHCWASSRHTLGYTLWLRSTLRRVISLRPSDRWEGGAKSGACYSPFVPERSSPWGYTRGFPPV